MAETNVSKFVPITWHNRPGQNNHHSKHIKCNPCMPNSDPSPVSLSSPELQLDDSYNQWSNGYKYCLDFGMVIVAMLY